ncbi:MAG: biotin--[acetyl-CoA-carboxylase] ligase [Chloroflexota bacterium]|nr:biotin--[acetyl-CoA-carboxylase] ligase [Chloroflexota bacterium]
MTNDKLPMTNGDSLSAQAITRGLGTLILGQHLEFHARVESTNDVARRLADVGAVDGSVVIADEQTAGRGRMGRTWTAPPGSSILMSLILRPRLKPEHVARVTMAAALGASDGIRAATELDAQIKWPNDIVLRGKKCAGILAEASTVGDQVEYVIVGLGVNVNFSTAEVEGTAADATTLRDELGKPVSRVPLIQAILRAIENCYLRLGAGENLRAEFAARLATLNQTVRARTPWGAENGVAEDVDDDGALLLRRRDGSITRLIAGDVTLSH